jgi:hypothetical protein
MCFRALSTRHACDGQPVGTRSLSRPLLSTPDRSGVDLPRVLRGNEESVFVMSSPGGGTFQGTGRPGEWWKTGYMWTGDQGPR